MTDLEAVQVTILEQNYTLTCPSGKEANLRRAAETLDKPCKTLKQVGESWD